MATIIELRSVTRAAAPMALAGTSAEIVLFPGVRYEKAAEAAPKPKKAKRRRDTLELET